MRIVYIRFNTAFEHPYFYEYTLYINSDVNEIDLGAFEGSFFNFSTYAYEYGEAEDF